MAVVYHEDAVTAGSTVIRGQQLSQLLIERCSDRLDTHFTSDVEHVTDSVVVLTKEAILRFSREQLERLDRRNIAVLYSWDDQAPRPELLGDRSSNLAMSFEQLAHFREAMPQPSFHLTLQPNRRLPGAISPQDRLRIAYFGDPANVAAPDSLPGAVALFSTIGVPEEAWMPSVALANCHWIVRPRSGGFKPFLKGFVASRYRAPVVTMRHDDALHYLGDDYPYFVDEASPSELERVVLHLQDTFGSKRWSFAQEIMDQVAARSAPERTCSEFLHIVGSLTE